VRWAGLYAIAAAVLFGAGAPLAKRLLGELPPVTLGGLLYLGAGAALLTARLVGGARGGGLQRADRSRVVTVALVGGLAAPVALVLGLARVSASAGSLLLNLEAPFTVALAALALHEPLGRRAVAAIALIAAAAAWTSFAPGPLTGEPRGAALVALACFAWAVDNTLSRALADRDPRAVVAAKGLIAGPLALAAAAALGEPLPPMRAVALALAVGATSYGASLALYLRAMRELGGARTSALFAAAPFVGVCVAWPVMHERPTVSVIAAGAAMALGVALLAAERHGHRHVHPAMDHEHLHVHDEHHHHAHRGDEGPEPHSHPHHHEPMEHAHDHALDLHHRHRH
jgi:drug/metabolite transporter (DMT)-like permease